MTMKIATPESPGTLPADRLTSMALPTGRVHAIRVVHVDDIPSVEQFYTVYAREPLIVKGVFAQNTFLQSLTREKVEQLFRGQQLQAYERTTQACVYVLADDLFAQLRQGEARYNVVDHPVINSPLATTFDVPLFLRQNWFLNSGSNADGYEKSLICSAAGSFTPIHVDAYGMQGWMYLLYGKKHWELYHPRDIPLLFDDVFKEFYHTRQHPSTRFPFAVLAEKYVGTIEKGDLLFFPAGWPHQVATPEESFGIGGSVINDYQIEQSMTTWLWERSLSVMGEINLKQLINNLSPERFSDEAGQQRTAAALALCKAWDERYARD